MPNLPGRLRALQSRTRTPRPPAAWGQVIHSRWALETWAGPGGLGGAAQQGPLPYSASDNLIAL